MQITHERLEDQRREIVSLLGQLLQLRADTAVHLELADVQRRERWRFLEERYARLIHALGLADDDTLAPIHEAMVEHRDSLRELLDEISADPEC